MEKEENRKNPWWKERVVYQIYPRSFQDTPRPDWDGIGDIPGIISRLDDIKDLGAGIIWLCPVYQSPDADNGYDISDYCSIDRRYGTMADMERLFAEAGKRDIKIIMDLVINHTSCEHEWFKKSRASGSPENPYRDYYIWREPGKGAAGKRKKPNNWTGFFMGETWEYDEKRGAYYLHLFDKRQPDLNYQNPAVIAEIKNVMKFWLDKGASGFRCDVINVIAKESLEDGRGGPVVRGIEHYKSREGNHAILRELRRDALDRYDCFTVGETVMVTLPEAKLFSDRSRGELDMLFYFEHLEVDRRIARFIPKRFNAEKLLAVLDKWQNGLEWNALYLENHDQARIVSHFGPAKKPFAKDGGPPRYWKESVKMFALLELSLKGTPYIFQGQEIGMTNFDFERLDQVNDVESKSLDALMRKFFIPKALRWKWIKASSRDNARTPMQWDAGENAGFSGAKPWLGINANYRHINYVAQKDDPDSALNCYKRLIRLRKETPCLVYGDFIPVCANSRILVYRRAFEGEEYTAAFNFSGRKARLPKKAAALLSGTPLFSSVSRGELNGVLFPWEGALCHNGTK